MKQKKSGIYVLIYLMLVLIFIALMVPGGIILTTDNVLPFRYQGDKNLIGTSLLILSFVALFASVKFLLWGMRNMAKNLDILFQNLGLTGEHYSNDGRHYLGVFKDRRIDIYCKPVKRRQYFGDIKTIRYVGHTMDVYVQCNLQTRSSIGMIRKGEENYDKIRSYMVKYLKEKFIKQFGGQIIKMDEPKYQGFDIYALDPNWTRRFIDNQQIFDLISGLFKDDIKCIRQHINVTPDSLHFTTLTNIRYLKPNIIDLIVDSLTRIAKEGELLQKHGSSSEEPHIEGDKE
jgi:hypothetical protein